MHTAIVADSTCDLSPELIERYNIHIVPLHVLLGDKEYRDGVDVTAQEIFAWSDEHKETPRTSAPSIDDAASVMRPLLDAGNELICFGISETMSSSCNVMRLAAKELKAEDRVHVINSMNLSTGIGHLVIEAAEMAKVGKDPDEIVSEIEALIPRVRASFIIDTLTYLHRGGRCSGLAALVGGALKLHPRINVIDGSMQPGLKYRGKPSHYIKAYVDSLSPEIDSAKPDRVFITHSHADPEIVAEVRKYLEGMNHFNEIFETYAAGVVSSHCGPGTLGVLFIAQDE